MEGLADGRSRSSAPDHAPRKRAGKDSLAYSQGLPGIATILPVLSEGYHKDACRSSASCAVVIMGLARIFNLEPAKGCIAVGADADLTLST